MRRQPLLGDRVRVLPFCPWAANTTGQVIGGIGGDRMRFRRVVPSDEGPRTFYFIAFDVPQVDEVGEGPYIGAELEEHYLEILPESA